MGLTFSKNGQKKNGVDAYYMNEDFKWEDIKQCQQPNGKINQRTKQVEPASEEELRELGVLYKYIPNEESFESELDKFSREFNYKNRDEVFVSPDRMGESNYWDKLKIFFEEHLHADDEVRFVKNGSGYFDVRNSKDQWIRIHVRKGDLIVLPAGIYHRFITDTSDFINAVRLFKEEPQWTPINRFEVNGQENSVAENHPIRQEYCKTQLATI